MQDTGNPRFDMARNAVGRRQDTSDPLLLNLNWNAPFVGSGTNACGVQPPLVCISQHYVLGNMYDRKTPYMIQYVFNVQRQLDSATAVEIGYLGSQSKRLERMFDANEVVPGPGSVQTRRPYPEFTKVQEIGNVAEAKYNSMAAEGDAAAQPWSVGAVRLHAVEVHRQRQRHPRAQRRRAVPAEQHLLRL